MVRRTGGSRTAPPSVGVHLAFAATLRARRRDRAAGADDGAPGLQEHHGPRHHVQLLKPQASALEARLDHPLWSEVTGKERKIGPTADRAVWPSACAWAVRRLMVMDEVFRPVVRELDASAWTGPTEPPRAPEASCSDGPSSSNPRKLLQLPASPTRRIHPRGFAPHRRRSGGFGPKHAYHPPILPSKCRCFHAIWR